MKELEKITFSGFLKDVLVHQNSAWHLFMKVIFFYLQLIRLISLEYFENCISALIIDTTLSQAKK